MVSHAGIVRRAREYGERARAYAMLPELASGDTRDRLLEHLEPVSDEWALDLGSGPGAMALALAPFVHRVVALDLAPEMLHAGRLGARRAGRMPALAVAGDALRLPLRDASFGVIACRHAARALGPPPRLAAELARVLVRGGRLGLVETVASGDPEIDRVLLALEDLHTPGPVALLTLAHWRETLTAAGLRADWADEPLYERSEGRSLLEWFASAGASTDVFLRARRLLVEAPKSVKDHLGLLVHGEDIVIHPRLGLVVAKRIA